jgi:4-amino-4-deoxy-L-arabinose transferase-like glycosyltransferase
MKSVSKTILPGLAFILLVGALLRLPLLAEIPLGLWFDEAWVSLRARDVVALRTYPIYFEANFGGIHPAVVYLTVLARWLSGNDPVAIRYGVAVAGVLALPLAFWAYREIGRLQPDLPFPPSHYALLSAFILAITFPFVILSRVGFETILPALPAAVAFGGLARGLRTGQRHWYALAGVALGLSLYTYFAARLLPVAFTVAVLGLIWAGQPRRELMVGWSITAVSALVIFLPFGLYFWQNWDLFLLRAGTTSYNTLGPGADSVPLALLRNLGRTIAGFSLPGFGDQLARHNIPGRPVFDIFLSLYFWLGMVVLLRRPQRPATILFLSWGGVMLLPTILTDGAPTFTRMLAAVPALAGIAGWGGAWLYQQIARRAGRLPFTAHRLPLLAGLVLFLSLLTTGTGVYHLWPQYHEVGTFGLDDWQAAQAALAALADGPVYLVPDLIHEGRPTFDLLLRDTAVRPATGRNCLPYQPGRFQTYLIDTYRDEGLLTRLSETFPQGEIRPLLSGLMLFTVDIPDSRPPPAPTAQFGPLTLLDYEIGEPANDGLPLRLVWQVREAPVPADYTIFLHLYHTGNTEAAPLAQRDSMPCEGGYATGRWQAGEVVIDEHWLPLPENEGGPLVVALGLYTWPSLDRVPLTGTADTLPGNRLILGKISLE